jgi:hypothetical protein
MQAQYTGIADGLQEGVTAYQLTTRSRL